MNKVTTKFRTSDSGKISYLETSYVLRKTLREKINKERVIDCTLS